MRDTFGNTILGVFIAVILLWAWFEPQSAGQWINEFRHGMTGGITDKGETTDG